MKKIAFVFAMVLATAAFAQQTECGQNKGRGRFNPEQFRAKQEAFLTRNANLTDDEAKKVFPLLKELKDKQRKLQKEAHQLKNQSKGGECGANKEPKEKVDYEKTVMRLAEIDKETAALEATYYKKMLKTIPAEKVFKLILAEDAFHRDMLQNFNRGPQEGKHGGPRVGKKP